MLSDSVMDISGVGPKTATLLEYVGIKTVQDLLQYYPRDYEDRSKIKDIASLVEGERVCVKVRPCGRILSIRKGKSMQKVTVADDTGELHITWFNHDYLVRSFDANREYTFFGEVQKIGGKICMTNPNINGMEGIVPVYPLTAGLKQTVLQKAIKNSSAWIDDMQDDFPPEFCAKYDLIDIQSAIRNIHFPESFEMFRIARRRLVFEELFMMQLGISAMKEHRSVGSAKPMSADIQKLLIRLPFKLTGAQKRVVEEVRLDMEKDVPMHRLIQGDVGSGKTIIAAIAMYIAEKSGMQAAIMAPTEVLAEQHYKNLSVWFENVELLCGKLTAKQKKEARERIKSGEAKIIVGTHALVQNDVEFVELGLVITDEQHRFGVRQRQTLSDKGERSSCEVENPEEISMRRDANISFDFCPDVSKMGTQRSPHMLVMTATPIPRTLALIIYGDLDVSIIDEMPPGRQTIDTFSVGEGFRARVNNFIREQVNKGRQVYIVCPLVEESETLDLKSVEEYQHSFDNTEIMHGRMKPKEKEDVMRRFVAGDIDILISTTVIEVGVDVPNASLMVIENSERFGLSQLHQLRGRVGRGAHKSYCVMLCQSDSDVAKQRMKIMCKTNDGFQIAEKDLELRGPGEFFGTRQHGLPELQIANLYNDMNILKEAGEAAREMTTISEGIQTRLDIMFRKTLL